MKITFKNLYLIIFLNHHYASKHHFASMKTNLIFYTWGFQNDHLRETVLTAQQTRNIHLMLF